MKLTKQEREYLADKVFWDLQYAEIDKWFISIHPEAGKGIEKAYRFYKNLYNKLKGEK